MTFVFGGIIITLAAFSTLTLLVLRGVTLEVLDARVMQALAPLRTPGWSSVWSGVTFFGSFIGITATALLIAFITRFDTELLLRGGVAVIGSAVAVQSMKRLVARARPATLSSDIQERQHSYPSGHTAAAAALYGFFSVVLLESAPSWMVALTAGLFIVLIGFSRVALSVHYLSDVVGGLLLGAFGIFAAFAMLG